MTVDPIFKLKGLNSSVWIINRIWFSNKMESQSLPDELIYGLALFLFTGIQPKQSIKRAKTHQTGKCKNKCYYKRYNSKCTGENSSVVKNN